MRILIAREAAALVVAGALGAWLGGGAAGCTAGPDAAPPLTAAAGGAQDGDALHGSARAALQQIREVEDHRLLRDPVLRRYLDSHDPTIAAAATVAVGRIGDLGYTREVIAALGRPSSRVRAAAAFSLGLLGGEDAVAALTTGLTRESDPAVRAQLALALGRVGSAASLPTLTGAATAADPVEVQAALAEGLGMLLRRTQATTPLAPELLLLLVRRAATEPEPRAVASAFALSVVPGAATVFPEDAVVAAYAAARATSARTYLARVLGRIGTPTALAALTRAARADRKVIARAEAVRQLARFAWSGVTRDALLAAVDDPVRQVAVYAIQGLAAFGVRARETAPELGRRHDATPSTWKATELLKALVAIDRDLARPRVERARSSPDFRRRLVAAAALAAYGDDADVAALAAMLGDADERVVAGVLDALGTLSPDRVPASAKEAARAALARLDVAVVSSVAAVAVAFGWTDFAADLAAIYDAFPRPVDFGERATILWALGALGATAHLTIVERGLEDSERIVAVEAATAYQALTGVDVSDRIPLVSRVVTTTPSWSEVARALHERVVLFTSRGVVGLRMLPEAPLTATNFTRLVRRGFYDGLTFHRVVPNFVAQGGDPRGDGYGGSDALVREELSRLPHRRGTVGVATAGKDTGSSQIFFNHGWNVHLDGRYTVFAEVSFGMDAVDRLEVGDVIHAAVVLEGSANTWQELSAAADEQG